MACSGCERLKAENKTLLETLERLRRLVSDMGGLHVKVEDSPYDDEHHQPWEKDEEER